MQVALKVLGPSDCDSMPVRYFWDILMQARENRMHACRSVGNLDKAANLTLPLSSIMRAM